MNAAHGQQVVEYIRADPDAAKIGELYAKAKSSIVDSVRYYAECGVRLRKKKDGLGHGNWLPWLRANADVLGFSSRRTAHMLMKLANGKSTSHLTPAEALALSRSIWGNEDVHNHRAQGTGENEWHTPEQYIELARSLLGEIDLDPASSAQAQETVKATSFYTSEDDGLVKPWFGKVWLNPPYSQPLIQQFVERLVDSVRSGDVPEAIMLTHNYTDTKWFHLAESVCARICFTRGRIAFIGADGNIAAPTQGQAFFYYGQRGEQFRAAFVNVGFVR